MTFIHSFTSSMCIWHLCSARSYAGPCRPPAGQSGAIVLVGGPPTQMRAAVGWVLWEPGLWMNEEGEISGRRGCEVCFARKAREGQAHQMEGMSKAPKRERPA